MDQQNVTFKDYKFENQLVFIANSVMDKISLAISDTNLNQVKHLIVIYHCNSNELYCILYVSL